MLTPNLDALAKQSVVFDRAYVQVSLCGPSRNSFMTGRRPDVTRVYSFADHFREQGVGADWESLPQIFKANGHLAFGVGKLYHPNLPPNYDGDNSWSPQVLDWDWKRDCPTCQGPIFNPVRCHFLDLHAFRLADLESITSQMELNACPGNQNPACHSSPGKPLNRSNPACAPTDPVDPSPYTADEVGGVKRLEYIEGMGGFGGGLMWCPKVPYQDLNITARAEQYMRIASAANKPFFLGVGLHKPHLPFQAPQEYFDKYPLDEVPLPLHKTFPVGAPSIAWHETMDSPSPWIPLPDWKLRETRRACETSRTPPRAVVPTSDF